MFRLDLDESRPKLVLGAHVREFLDYLRLRRDRVRRDHLGPGKHDGIRDRMVAHDHFLHQRVSSSIDIAQRGHSCTQIPHPLQ